MAMGGYGVHGPEDSAGGSIVAVAAISTVLALIALPTVILYNTLSSDNPVQDCGDAKSGMTYEAVSEKEALKLHEIGKLVCRRSEGDKFKIVPRREDK